MNYYAVIMAGGSGTRLWPLSRQYRPKQSLTLVGQRTMFQHAVDRLAPLFPPERILVVTRREYAAGSVVEGVSVKRRRPGMWPHRGRGNASHAPARCM